MSTNIISQLFYSHFDEDKFKSHVTNHISHVTNHISQITCHKSHVTNQISLYIQIEAFLLVLFWFHSLALTNYVYVYKLLTKSLCDNWIYCMTSISRKESYMCVVCCNICDLMLYHISHTIIKTVLSMYSYPF